MAALNKISANSPSRANPSELETQIATAIYDLETGTADMKAALRPLNFVSAREVRRFSWVEFHRSLKVAFRTYEINGLAI